MLSGEVFEKVWFGDGEPKGLSSNGDSGTVTLYPDRIEFDGKKLRATLTDIRSTTVEKVPGYFGAIRVRVLYGTGSGVEQQFFFDAYNMPKGRARLRRLAQAITSTYATLPPSPDDRLRIERLQHDETESRLASGRRNMWIGAGLAVVGGLITIVTYAVASSSSSGGRYLFAYGPIIFGLGLFVTGLVQVRGASRTEVTPGDVEVRTRVRLAWWLAPILGFWVGGLVAWFANKGVDRRVAIAMLVTGFAWSVVLGQVLLALT